MSESVSVTTPNLPPRLGHPEAPYSSPHFTNPTAVPPRRFSVSGPSPTHSPAVLVFGLPATPPYATAPRGSARLYASLTHTYTCQPADNTTRSSTSAGTPAALCLLSPRNPRPMAPAYQNPHHSPGPRHPPKPRCTPPANPPDHKQLQPPCSVPAPSTGSAAQHPGRGPSQPGKTSRGSTVTRLPLTSLCIRLTSNLNLIRGIFFWGNDPAGRSVRGPRRPRHRGDRTRALALATSPHHRRPTRYPIPSHRSPFLSPFRAPTTTLITQS